MEFQVPGNVTDSGLNNVSVLNDTLASPSQHGGREQGHSSFLGGLMCRAECCGKPFGLQSMPVPNALPRVPGSALVKLGSVVCAGMGCPGAHV